LTEAPFSGLIIFYFVIIFVVFGWKGTCFPSSVW